MNFMPNRSNKSLRMNAELRFFRSFIDFGKGIDKSVGNENVFCHCQPENVITTHFKKVSANLKFRFGLLDSETVGMLI